MIIDTKELRRLAQEATPGPWRIGAMESGRVAIDGVNGSEVTGFIDPEDGHLILAAANPQAILELLDRLEAAEKERDALRAKIEAMERQEPVAWLHETRRDSDVVTDAVKHVWGKAAVGSMAAYSIPLYALPGAQTQGEEK